MQAQQTSTPVPATRPSRPERFADETLRSMQDSRPTTPKTSEEERRRLPSDPDAGAIEYDSWRVR